MFGVVRSFAWVRYVFISLVRYVFLYHLSCFVRLFFLPDARSVCSLFVI